MRIVEQGQRRPVAVAPDDDPVVRAELEALAADVDSPHTALERAEVSSLVQIALDYLPGRYGDILEWKYVHGLSVTEIASRLESTPKAVESMLSRARHAFREAFTALSRTRVTHEA